VTVESLDAREDFAVVAARDQDLRARANGGLEDGQRSSGKLMFFNLRDFVFSRQQSEPECYIEGETGGRTSTLVSASPAALCDTLALCYESNREQGTLMRTESLRQPWWRCGSGGEV
jgi:hypothetical protein